MSFEGFVRVTNNSGEDYEDAQVRLVVGTINLVEKIAQLAQMPMDKSPRCWLTRGDQLERRCGQRALDRCRGRAFGGGRAGGIELERSPGKGNHQGRPERVLHLHDRRDRNDPQWLVEADAIA